MRGSASAAPGSGDTASNPFQACDPLGPPGTPWDLLGPLGTPWDPLGPPPWEGPGAPCDP
eukprot:853125-Prymnesium_polylepis.1